MQRRLAGVLALGIALGLGGPAGATILVSFDPPSHDVVLDAGTATVDLVADIPETDAIVGWGLDLTIAGSSAALDSIAINEALFDAVFAPDGDGLAALVPQDSLWGDDIVLATLTFSLIELGPAVLTASATPDDPTEGFPRDPAVGGFAEVTYDTGLINVIPEPAGLLLFAAFLLVRRR